jgi:hypothetical protein
MNNPFHTALFKPFDRVAGAQALSLGLVVLLVQSILAFYFNSRFDGLLNLHFGAPLSFSTVAIQVAINWLSIAFCMYLLALTFGAKSMRLIDLLGTSALSFYPFALAPLLNASGYFSALNSQIEDNPLKAVSGIAENQPWFFALSAVLMLALIVWQVALLWNAFSVLTNLKKPKLIIAFILALFAACILSVVLTRLI